MDELLEWKICRGFDRQKLLKIKLIHIYNEATEAYYVDVDDQVFHLKLDGSFGISSESRVEALCDQEIVSFVRGQSHFMALSKTGRAHGWGRNNYGQLAVAVDSESPQIASKLSEHVLVKFKCGDQHSLAMTDKGEALAWGRSDSGQCGVEAESVTPTVLMENVVDIAASGDSSCFLTKDGRIFELGYKMGCDSRFAKSYVSKPSEVKLGLTRIKQIVMGRNHVLALTERCSLLAWGTNDQGQLGYGTTSASSTPITVKVPSPEGEEISFLQVAALMDTSASMTVNGHVYVWGDQTGSTVPMEVALRSLDTVFARLDKPEGTFRNLSVDCQYVQSDIMKAFNNPEQSDCQFIVDDQVIYAKKGILELRSEYLRKMLNGEWTESGGVIKIKNHSYPVYYAFIYYLYTDILDINDDLVLELIELAHEVMNNDLSRKCAERIRRQLTIDNVCDVFLVARKLDLKNLLTYCRLFGQQNLCAVLRTDSYDKLSEHDAYCFTRFVARNQLTTDPVQ